MEKKTKQKMMSRITGFLICLAMAFVFLPIVNAKAADVASVTLRYFYSNANDDFQSHYEEYRTDNYSSIQEAFNEATKEQSYKSQLPAEKQENFRYETSVVKLLQDVTVSNAVTLNGDYTYLDLNGHSFTVTESGSLTGSGSLTVESTSPGVLNNSGTIEVGLDTWTGDTFNFTGGTVSNFGVDGGTINISGGMVDFSQKMINNGGDADINVTISGTAAVINPHIYVYTKTQSATKLNVIISQKALVEGLKFEAFGGADEIDSKPNLLLKGGYYDKDPNSLLASYDQVTYEADKLNTYYVYNSNYGGYVLYSELDDADKAIYGEYDNYYVYNAEGNKDFIKLEKTPEQYNNQSDWAANGKFFTWRIKDDSATDVAVTGVSLNKTTLSLAKGASETLTATVAPANATNKTVTWTSDNTAVATVTNGKVTAVVAGKAKITAKAGDKTAVCEVTVTEASSGSGSGTQDGKDQGQNPTTGTVTAKKANTLTAKGKTISLKAKDVKKKNKKFKAAKAYTIKKAEGTLSYKLKTAKNTKDKKNYKKKFAVDSKSGQITVKKGLKKGTYKLTVTVTAAGNDGFEKGSKTATVTVKVK